MQVYATILHTTAISCFRTLTSCQYKSLKVVKCGRNKWN